MAEEHTGTNVETEVQDRGVFDFLKKDEEKKPHHETLATELEKVKISDSEEKKEEEAEKKLHRSNSSSSSSSSEEEVEEGGEKIRRKKKKGEKIPGGKKAEEVHIIEPTEDTSVPIEKYDAEGVGVVAHDGEVKHPEEKKSFMEKIKDKLPGAHKKPEETGAPVAHVTEEAVPTSASAAHVEEAEPKEKKGILEKIKEKLPGYHKTEEEKKEATDL